MEIILISILVLVFMGILWPYPPPKNDPPEGGYWNDGK
jgi:hypothetical protein